MPTITFTVDGPSSNTGGTLTFRPRTSFADPETGDILTPEKSRRPVEYVCNTPATVELPDGPWEVGGLEHNRLFPIDVSADALLKDLIVFGLPTTAPVTTLSQAVTVWLDANVNTEVTDTLIAGAVTTPGSEAKTALDAAYAPKWLPSTAYTAGTLVMLPAPINGPGTRNSSGTSRSSFDATEQGLWTATGSGVSSWDDLEDKPPVIAAGANAGAARTAIGAAPTDSVPAAYQSAITSTIITNELIDDLAEETGYTWAVVDTAGRVAIGVDAAGHVVARLDLADGLVTEAKLATEVADKLVPDGVALPAPLPAGTQAFAITDADDRVAFEIGGDGTTRVQKMWMATQAQVAAANQLAVVTRSNRYRLATFGDSLTRGFGPSADWDPGDAWPAKLGLPAAVSVFNRGVSGQTIDEINLRSGALTLSLAVTGGEIPATTDPVTVTTTQTIGWRPDRTWTFDGTLAGVPGTLTRTGTAMTSFTFARTTPGTAVPVAGTAPFVSAQNVHAADTVVVFAGRNDISYSVTGPHGSIVEHVVEGTAALVEHLTPQVRHVLLVGTINSTAAAAGSAEHTMVTQINTQLAARYPGRFWDLRAWLVHDAIYALGLIPDSTDLANINSDRPPPQIMHDTIHYKQAVAAALGPQIANQLVTRGWV
ncbi:minor tail protein [Gordonia phage Lilas]|nr:minor tail protein [Gordonia phage Lilas]